MTICNRIWVLGAPDPEMERIEALLRERGEIVVHATVAGIRVHPGNANRTDSSNRGMSVVTTATTVYAVECDGPLFARTRTRGVTVVTIDHHQPGDPGYGRSPKDFVSASSIGQVIIELSRLIGLDGWEEICGNGHAGHGLELPKITNVISHVVGEGSHSARTIEPTWVCWWDSDVAEETSQGYIIPNDLVLAAAADHCLGAAYRGECPGVDPDELMKWRAETRAAFQGRPVSDVMTDIERAQQALRGAEQIIIDHTPGGHCGGNACGRVEGGYGYGGRTGRGNGDCYCDCDGCEDGDDYITVRDMRRPEPIPELPEAALRLGVSYISGPLIGPDNRHKYTCSGSTDVIRAWMETWALSHGLVDIYGDPARGFAGGYLAE